MNPGDGPRLRPLLAPLSWLYGAWIAHRNARYERPGASASVPATVVSVGNLSVGGTGKTPLVHWLTEHMLGRDVPTAIVSRGYRGQAGKGPVVVSEGRGPVCSATISGDEPWMLARVVPRAIVVVGSDRVAGAGRAIELGARLILLDDGFQHRALARDVDIVLLDRTRPFDRDRLLPSGWLREPARSLARANWVVFTRSPSPEGAEPLAAAVRRHAPHAELLHADHRATGFSDVDARPVAPPERAVAFCAIGHPARFRADLQRLGVAVDAFHPLRDHQSIEESQLDTWRAEAARQSAALVTTDKDLARIGPETARRFGLVVMGIETLLPGGEALIEAISARLDKRS